MKNLVQASPTNDGTKHLELTAPSSVSSGDFLHIGEIPCVAVADVATGEKGTFLVEQIIRYSKAAVSFSEGQAVYFDGSVMTDTDGGGANDLAGYAVSDESSDVVLKMAAHK